MTSAIATCFPCAIRLLSNPGGATDRREMRLRPYPGVNSTVTGT